MVPKWTFAKRPEDNSPLALKHWRASQVGLRV